MADQPIVFSFQGAFGPPTLGHYTAMKLYAKKIVEDYPLSTNILMLFMPTALGSKAHLEPTQQTRIAVLNTFCFLLKSEFRNYPTISFSPSDIEYELCREPKPDGSGPNRDTGTYRTIARLKEKYSDRRLLLGMGFDNMLQLPYWKNVDTYKTSGVEKIYVAYRELTRAEEERTRSFNIGGKILKLDITIPNWGESTFSQARRAFDIEGGDLATLNQNLAAKVDNKEGVYECNLDLPEIEIVGDSPEETIPATSSSMMRYYICKFIKENNEEDREKIRLLMWGSTPTNVGVNETIEDYRDKIFTEESVCPPDDHYDEKISQIDFATSAGAQAKIASQSAGIRKSRKIRSYSTKRKRDSRKKKQSKRRRRRIKYSKKN